MDSKDYFQISKTRHYMQLDRDAVQQHCPAGWQPESSTHPWVEISGRPTLAAYRFIQEASRDNEDQLAEITLAVTIKRVGGDWRLYAGSWGEESPSWPDLCDQDGLEIRRRLVSRLYDTDLVSLGDIANDMMTVSGDQSQE